MSDRTHECTKPGCYYCYETTRICLIETEYDRIENERFRQDCKISYSYTADKRNHPFYDPYSAADVNYIVKNINLPACILAKQIGRSVRGITVKRNSLMEALGL